MDAKPISLADSSVLGDTEPIGDLFIGETERAKVSEERNLCVIPYQRLCRLDYHCILHIVPNERLCDVLLGLPGRNARPAFLLKSREPVRLQLVAGSRTLHTRFGGGPGQAVRGKRSRTRLLLPDRGGGCGRHSVKSASKSTPPFQTVKPSFYPK